MRPLEMTLTARSALLNHVTCSPNDVRLILADEKSMKFGSDPLFGAQDSRGIFAASHPSR
jgi:hypothetical protein